MAAKLAERWLADYGEHHRNTTNRVTHGVAVPVIFFCLLAFAWSLPVPAAWEAHFSWFKWSFVAIPVLAVLYAGLSLTLASGLLAFMAVCNEGLLYLDLHAEWPAWKICAGPFVVAWLAVFIANRFEQKQPPFLKRAVFIGLGPAWLLGTLLRKIGLKY